MLILYMQSLAPSVVALQIALAAVESSTFGGKPQAAQEMRILNLIVF